MGNARLNDAVLDAGPLIHLDQIGCPELLNIFHALYIPDAVWAETVENVKFGNISTSNLVNLKRHSILANRFLKFIRNYDLKNLHAGETECLYLCQNKDISILLTDDLAVREASKRFGITPVGSLGIVVRAYRKGHISIDDAEKHIADLYDVSNLFVSRVIVEMAIAQLHEKAV